MDAHTFALVSMFGLPFSMMGVLVVASRLFPAWIWKSLPMQVVATAWVLGCLAAPVAVIHFDGQGDHFDSVTQLVREAFALPEGVEVNKQGDKTVRLGDCWRNAVNWRSEVVFPTGEAFDRWTDEQGFRAGIIHQIAAYFGVPSARIRVLDGALDLRERDPRYELRKDHNAYQWNVRILPFYHHPFLCTAIERDADALTLRPCDPIAAPFDQGSAGWVVMNPDPEKKRVEGRIYYAQGPSTCSNPIRRAVNDALGLPHLAGEPNTSMGGTLPGF